MLQKKENMSVFRTFFLFTGENKKTPAKTSIKNEKKTLICIAVNTFQLAGLPRDTCDSLGHNSLTSIRIKEHFSMTLEIGQKAPEQKLLALYQWSLCGSKFITHRQARTRTHG